MRLTVILLLSIALVSAGCFGGDDEGEGGDAGTTPSPTPATPTPTTPTPDDGTGGDGGNETTEDEGGETPSPPVEVYNQTHDFSHGDVTGETPVDETATVPEGHGEVIMNVTWLGEDTPTLNSELSVTLLDPEGTAAGTCSLGVGAQSGADQACTVTAAAVAGDWIVRYEGAGTTKAQVSVVAA